MLFEGTAETIGNTYSISNISNYKYLYIIANITNMKTKLVMLIDVDDISYGSERGFLINLFLHSTAWWTIGFDFKDSQTLYISDIKNSSGWPNNIITQAITCIIGIK